MQFLYFDLGKVLLNFSVDQMLRQIATAAGCETSALNKLLFSEGLQRNYELGRVTSRQFYELFCQRTGVMPAYEALALASSDIFTLNCSIVPVAAHLRRAGCRLGILSNTCEVHWEHCRRSFPILDELFGVHALSYRIGAMKPDPEIYQAAAALAGSTPHQIFFTDDLAENVAGAQAAGFDAVQYTSTPQLVSALRDRGVRFDY